MKDLRQSPAWANYLKSINWQIEKVDGIYIYLKRIPILGWFAKIQHPEKLNSKTINFIEKKYRPLQFSIEPLSKDQTKILDKLNFEISKFPSLPTKTLIIDLTKSQNELIKSFAQKTRYNIHLSKKRQVKIIESKDILDFTNFWRQNFEKKRFPFMSQQKNIIAMQKTFNKNAHILLSFRAKSRNPSAALFILIHDKIAYYMYAAANDEGRSNFAPTLLTWNAILLAKKSGCKTFDFDGIYDERFPIESWYGFTKFKYGFTKKEIKYPGRYVKTKSWFKI